LLFNLQRREQSLLAQQARTYRLHLLIELKMPLESIAFLGVALIFLEHSLMVNKSLDQLPVKGRILLKEQNVANIFDD
jgi:hypothetical protein